MMTSKELKKMKEDLQNQFENKKTIVISINVDILIELIENQEKLKQAIDILKEKLWLYKEHDYRLAVNCSHDYVALSKMDYELLKGVLGNDN